MTLKKFFTSRKTIIAVLLLASATLLTVYGKMSNQEWLDFVKWIYGIFVVGNVTAKFTGTKNE